MAPITLRFRRHTRGDQAKNDLFSTLSRLAKVGGGSGVVVGNFDGLGIDRIQSPIIGWDCNIGFVDLFSRYKIKLRKSGYRLVYDVVDDRLVILVIAIGKRNREAVYEKAAKR